MFKISSNGHAWYLFSPFIFEWVVSIVMLIVYRCRLKEVKRKVMNIVLENKNKIKNPSKENLKAICKKLRLRTKYCKHNVFENCVQGIIIFFVPVFLKITVFKDSTYHTIFLTASSLFYGSLFVTNIIKILIKNEAEIVKNWAKMRRRFKIVRKYREAQKAKKHEIRCSITCKIQ